MFVQLPDIIQDVYHKYFGEPASKEILTLLRRDLMQAIWALLLNAEFLSAYKNGIIVLCGDGKKRRIFPRIFTYSADYPEQYILSSRFRCIY